MAKIRTILKVFDTIAKYIAIVYAMVFVFFIVLISIRSSEMGIRINDIMASALEVIKTALLIK